MKSACLCLDQNKINSLKIISTIKSGDRVFVKNTKKLSKYDNSAPDFKRGDKLLATVDGALEWKTNSNVIKPGLSNRNRRQKQGGEGQYVSLRIKEGDIGIPQKKQNCRSMYWN